MSSCENASLTWVPKGPEPPPTRTLLLPDAHTRFNRLDQRRTDSLPRLSGSSEWTCKSPKGHEGEVGRRRTWLSTRVHPKRSCPPRSVEGVRLSDSSRRGSSSTWTPPLCRVSFTVVGHRHSPDRCTRVETPSPSGVLRGVSLRPGPVYVSVSGPVCCLYAYVSVCGMCRGSRHWSRNH